VSVTVVVPVLNGAATLAAQLHALDRQLSAPPFDVIVVDNGSVDETAVLAARFPATTYSIRVVSETVRGINSARNAGVSAALDGAVLLCDADDEVHPGWVAAMTAALDEGTWVAGRLDYERLNSARCRTTWGAASYSEFRVSEPFSDSTYGCNCGFWRSMWAELGGFDTRISGTGGDENEFFQRAWAAGFHPVYVPTALVSYRLREGVRAMLRQRYRQGRNLVLLQDLPGGRLMPGELTLAATWRGLARRVVVAPKYLWSSASRSAWAAAVASHLGRLKGFHDRTSASGRHA
jgi:glycosyltransferase involved in cell wall biosynthesis